MLKKVRIGDLGEIYTGNTPSKKIEEYYESNDIMFIKPDVMSFDIKIVDKSNEYISEKARSKARIVPQNSLLVSCIGNIGKLAINKKETAFNQQVNAIVNNDNIVSSKYLAYLLKYNQKKLEAIANAPVVPIINKTQFSNFEVLIHDDLGVQKRIIEVLDKAQELINKKKDQIEQLDELVKSRFIEMFGDHVKNPKCWKYEKLENITYKITDGKHGDCKNEDSSGYYFISAKDINDRKIYVDNARQITKVDFDETNKRTNLQVDDLVIVNTGASIGKTAIATKEDVSKNLTFQKSVAIITVNSNILTSKFLEQYIIFDRDRIYKNASGSAQKNWLLSQMRSYKIILPPIKLQNQFADFVDQVDRIKLEMENSLEELEDNFNSLMQKAFKGELF
ncbi:MAG: restriction endonuclease subunit S [Romboutsia timonensis]|uniref:restriction endonuclease subunit S n=1 Tax=Romboutsia timonensis TaxID=1776391 RepID=UPI002A74D79C|nr:restriction endonuclease subunit S [Romboutsia timonensis]MDY2881927.1 restriction endonuclease subunit S [Romboutsia timonensis]